MEIEKKDIYKYARRDNQFSESGVKKVITSVPVKKPNKHTFIRILTREDTSPFTVDMDILELKDGINNETYFINPEIVQDITTDFVLKRLYVCIDRQNNIFVWPIRLPDELGKLDEWNKSAHEGAKNAIKSWIRISANKSLGRYDIFEALGNISAPIWPNLTFEEIIEKAIIGKTVDTLDHPILKTINGEI